MSELLIQEPPLQVLPSLACKVGLNEAIILQQFHYWLQRSNNIKDGHKWIYNSYSEWHKQFSFWSERTMRRAINNLEKQGYLITGNYNKAGFDNTKWYRIDYQKLVDRRLGQNDQTIWSNCPRPTGQNDQTNTNRIPETTTENNSSSTDIENKHNAFELYQVVVGILTPMQSQNLSEYIQNLSDDVVKFAINSMTNQTSKPNFNYLNRILMKYEKLGINTVEKAEELEKQHQAKRKPKKKAVKRTNEPSEEWGGW